MADELEKLFELKQKGILTAEEFDRKKQQLL
ncbi:MAG: SHOCT domain-containing protein [Chitinophagaceae bacterium]|nr:MAG: SHOCT domain-containing protein [Chitinophagaceae bacterium]